MILTSTYGSLYEGVQPIIMDECAGIEPVDFSGYSLLEATYKILEEDATNWNNIIQSAALFELQYLKENGVEVVYEEEELVGEKNSWMSKAIDAVKSWVAKVMGMIKNAAESIAAAAVTGLKNIGVNKKLANPVWPEGKSFKTPDYFKARFEVDKLDLVTTLDIGKDAMAGLMTAATSDLMVRELENKVKESSGKDGSACSAGDIKKHVLSKVGELTVNGNVKYSSAIAELNAYKGDIKAIKAIQKEARDGGNAMIKSLKAARAHIKSESKLFGAVIKLVGKINAFNTNLISAKLSVHIGSVMLARKIAAVYSSHNTATKAKAAAGSAKNTVKRAAAKVTRKDAKDDEYIAGKTPANEGAYSRIPDVEIL